MKLRLVRPNHRLARLIHLGLVTAIVGALAASAAPASGADELPPYPGSLPDTSSAQTVTGRGGEFENLQVHVNQTTDLTTQAVSVTWNWPGHITRYGRNFFNNELAYAGNFVAVMQCWGAPVTDANSPENAANFVPGNPGPAREQCEYGGSAERPIPNTTTFNQTTRKANQAVATATQYGDETVYPTKSGSVDIPFRAADGTVIPTQTAKDDTGTNVYANTYYDSYSTNELPANYTFGPDGRGGVQFQVQNAADSNGLSCGGRSLDCWLVVVPQGVKDLDGKPFGPANGTPKLSAFSSPLASTNWANRIAIPLSFKPVQTACASAGNTYETLGTPLVNNAMLSWQAKLCATADTTFNFSLGTDDRSRDALSVGTDAMQFVSDPANPQQTTVPVTYAPVTLSGVGLAFVWDKALVNARGTQPGLPLPTVRLNPRLVAKLLTYSYQGGGFSRIGDLGALRKPGPEQYGWLENNPEWIGADPEFLALNPELADLGKGNSLYEDTIPIAAVQGPLDGNDGIAKLWQWIMADKDARAFLAGASAPGGMNVDPYFSTNPDLNPSGTAFDPTNKFPYADPWTGIPGSNEKLCDQQSSLSLTDIWPAARDLGTVARDILTVNPLEKYTGGYQCPNSADASIGWKTSRSGIATVGQRQLMGFTDTASGAQYGVSFASLENSQGEYVAPTTASITAAANTLTPTDVKGVVQPSLTSTDKTAYPLALLSYAGVTTDGMPAASCAAYATLLRYASADGQQSGSGIGQLPPGYVPLTAALRAQTAQAAATVAQCRQEPDPSVPPTDTGTGSAPVDDEAPVDEAPVDEGTTTDPETVADPVSDTGVTGGSTAAGGTKPNTVSLASKTTRPDPAVFAYVVPVAAGIGLLSLLVAPLAGLRRRRTGGGA